MLLSSVFSGLILATYVRTQAPPGKASRFGVGGSVPSHSACWGGHCGAV